MNVVKIKDPVTGEWVRAGLGGTQNHASRHGKDGTDPLTPAMIGAVPTTRKVNNKELSADITLSSADVLAAPRGLTMDKGASGTAGNLETWLKTKFDAMDTSYWGIIHHFMYNAQGGFENTPGAAAGVYFFEVQKQMTGYGSITATGYNGYILQMTCKNNVWTPWEWINPPMALGVEYRTTERYMGKPVYCKLIDCGALTANTFKIATALSANGDKAVRAEAVVLYKTDSWYAAPYNDTNNNLTFIANGLVYSGEQVRVGLLANFNSTQSYATVYYTKTTD